MLSRARDRYLLALQHRDYRTLWIANSFAGGAAWALIIARGWLAYEITDTYLWVGIVTFATMVPRLFATPVLGFLADRFDRQTLLSWTYTFNLSHNVVLAMLVMLGYIDGAAGPWILLILSFVNGILRSGQMTTTQSLIPNLVPKEHLLNAIALNQATQQGSRLLGALSIIPLLGLVEIHTAFWLCSGLYLAGLVQVNRISTRSRGKMDPERGFLSNLMAGFTYVYHRPLVLAMVLLVVAHCSLTMSYESILPAISVEKLQAGSVGVSYLIAGVGAGALAASIFIAGVSSEVTRGRLFLFFGFTSGIGPILLALSSSRELSIAATVIMGINQAGFMTISHAIIQSLIDDSVRGRVAGVYSMHVGGSMAVTNLINATLADVFNAPVVLIAGGLLFIFAITISMGNFSLRRIYFPRAVAVPAI